MILPAAGGGPDTGGEREKPLRLGQIPHERVIGQDAAVRLFDAITRARSGSYYEEGGRLTEAVLLGNIAFNAATFTTNVVTLRLSPNDLVAALIVAVCIGAAGGFGPAWRAAHLRPIEALRKA